MTQQKENVDFSGLFKLDVLIHLDISSYAFYEVGLKKFLAISSDNDLVFIYIDALSNRIVKNYDWDFLDNPIYCMCFEPSGTWLQIVSDQKILLVPYLPLFTPQNTYDYKWSQSSVTVLPLGTIVSPTSVVWWLTRESDNILIIGSKTGTIYFYSLELQTIVGDCKVPGEIFDLQICFDDSLDLLALLISSSKNQQWKLVLEHRSYAYNWLLQIRAQSDKDKKDGFMSLLRQLSKDKITLLMQGSSKDDKSQSVEHSLKPVDYLPIFRKGSNNWALTAQYVNGRHFLSAFELNEGTLILESPEEESPSRTLHPRVKNDGLYKQGLWSQKLIYLLRKNELEVHSASFSVIQGEALLTAKQEYTQLWSAELIGDVVRAFVLSAKTPAPSSAGWKEPTFVCDLPLPRFALEPCLIVTTSGAYLCSTVSEPCEWLVGAISRGGHVESRARALGAPLPPLLRAAADLLLARGKIVPASWLYALTQSPIDGWVARLGVFGRLHELAMYKPSDNSGSLGNAAITLKLIAILLKIATNDEEHFDTDSKLTTLTTTELQELSAITAAIGLWDLLPVFTIHQGYPDLFITAVKGRKDICRGALMSLVKEPCLVTVLLEEGGQWFFDFIKEKCTEFDTDLLKDLCIWLNPLQDELRPIMRDLKDKMNTIFAPRVQALISSFIRMATVIESREPCRGVYPEPNSSTDTWMYRYIPKRAVSCGLEHWAIVHEGNAKIQLTNTPINTEVIGRVLDVACGRHHTLILTENGVYASGDNTYGQLGVGAAWGGGAGAAGGAARRVRGLRGGRAVRALAAGYYHSAAVGYGGQLYTWGWGVHGQLGHGTIDDEHLPKLVAKLQGRKVLDVGCGACHSVVLMKNGEAWAFGASVFGQLGTGSREKSSVPVRVSLNEPIVKIAVGYFHTLALTAKELFVWGASPQQVRAEHERRAPGPEREPHLLPARVDTRNVRRAALQLAAGWHHSCIVDEGGTLYSWGLNFDGQLGCEDRKQVVIPTEVKMRHYQNDRDSDRSPERDSTEPSRALVACGGDFTIYVDDDGKIYAAGNTHVKSVNEKEKGSNRVIMMKTKKRVIKIPANRSHNKLIFEPIDRTSIMFPFDLNDLHRNPLEPILDPLDVREDFNKQSWADHIVFYLKSWIKEEDLAGNTNMGAKLAYHTSNYSDCLRLLLESLKQKPQVDKLYTIHSDNNDDPKRPSKKDEMKIAITNTLSKRIKDISLTMLNEEPYPAMSPLTYQNLPCCCDELKRERRPQKDTKPIVYLDEIDLSVNAARTIDKCIELFPVDTKLWETCFRLSKNFFLENNLDISKLEEVLRKYMKSNASTMAAAIMYSNDCAQYSKILSPKFYLNMCSQVMDTWG